MSDSEAVKAPRHLHPVRTPHPEAEAAQQKAAAEKAAKKGKRKAPVSEDRAIPEFTKPADALAAVVKSTQAAERAEAKMAELGKALGQETKKRREALEEAVAGIDSRSAVAMAIKDAFSARDEAAERRSKASAAAKKAKDAIAKAFEEVDDQDAESVRKARKAYDKLQAHLIIGKDERAEAKSKVTEARQKRDANVDGARQLVLGL